MTDMQVFSGRKDGYGWITIRSTDLLLYSFLKVIPEAVVNHVVAITSFDSGPLKVSEDERALGWFNEGSVLWTTPITDPERLPSAEYDEWYVFDQHVRLPELDRLVNYGGFGLDDPRPLWEANPTWDKKLYKSKLALQKTFWTQMEMVRPISYIAEGDCFNLATNDEQVFERAIEWSRNPLAAQ